MAIFTSQIVRIQKKCRRLPSASSSTIASLSSSIFPFDRLPLRLSLTGDDIRMKPSSTRFDVTSKQHFSSSSSSSSPSISSRSDSDGDDLASRLCCCCCCCCCFFMLLDIAAPFSSPSSRHSFMQSKFSYAPQFVAAAAAAVLLL